MTFDLSDKRHLLAAEGWLELGLPREAHKELKKITPELRDHPDVLDLRWHILAEEEKWEACVMIADAVIKLAPERPDGWIHRSFALHELKRTQEAFDQLLPVAGRFPKVWTIPYNLACYSSQLRKFGEALKWFEEALTMEQDKVQQAIKDDEDLKPLLDWMDGVR